MSEPDRSDALDQARAELSNDPTSVDAAATVIRELIRLGRPTEARRVHLRLKPGLHAHPELLFARAALELALGKPAKALRHLETAAHAAPNDPLPLMEMASICLGLDQPEDAAGFAHRALERAGEDVPILLQIMTLLENAGAEKEATGIADSLLERNAESVDLHEMIGMHAFQAGDSSLAVEHLAEAALAGRRSAFHPLGLLVWNNGRNANVAASLHLFALREFGPDRDNLRELGLIEQIRNRRARGADLLCASVRLDPESVPPLLVRRWLSREATGRSLEALLEEMGEPSKGEIAWACALVYLDRGQSDNARRWVERTLELDPSHNPARVQLIRFLEEDCDIDDELPKHFEALDWDSLPVEIRREMEEIRGDEGQEKGDADGANADWRGEIGRLLDPDDGRAPPWIGRQTEVERLLQLLSRPSRRSALLIGARGVGKSAVVREVARRIASAEASDPLAGHRFVELSPAELQTNIKYMGEWQTKISKLAADVKERGKTFLYIPRIDQLLGAGTHEHSDVDMLTVLAPLIESDALVVIGQSPPAAAKRMLRVRPELARALTQIELNAPSREETRAILSGSEGWIRAGGPRIERAAVDRAIDVCARFLRHRDFPGKGIDLLRRTVERVASGGGELVTAEDVAEEMSATTGLPSFLLLDSERLDLARANRFFTERVLGQDPAIEALIDTLARVKTGLQDPERPLACYLFAGPTGVGKTETAKALAAFLFSDEKRLVRLDMSEFSDPNAVDRLIQGDPRQVGSRGQLTGAVRENPLSVLLLDEIEKAHPRVFDLLLQVLGEGRLTDAKGETVDFRECVILMTSNLGYERGGDGAFGFQRDREEAVAEAIRGEVERFFRPELFNRIDRVVHFYGLSRETFRKIAQREIGRCLAREGIVRRGVVVETDPRVADLVLERGESGRYGARQLKRAVEDLVAVPLARLLAEHAPAPTDTVRLLTQDARVIAEIVRDEPDTSDRPAPRTPAPARGRGDLRAARGDVTRLRDRIAGIEEALEVDRLRDRGERIRADMAKPSFWDDTGRSTETLRELARVTQILDRQKAMERKLDEVVLLIDLVAEGRKERVGELDRRITDLSGLTERVELETVLSDDGDARAAYVLISAAQRGGAAREWASTLVRMYERWAAHRRYGVELQGERLSVGSEGRAAVLRIDGPNAFGLLRGETGTHRRIAGNSKTGAREVTSARVLVLPDPPSAEGKIDPDYRAQKADELIFLGESCGVVTIAGLGKAWRIHTPLPRREALELGRDLASGLIECRASLEVSLSRIARNVGLLKRRYAKDPRTGHQVSDVAAVLNGKIDDFILAALLEMKDGAEGGERDNPAAHPESAT